MSRVLVAGGAGTLGLALVRRLLADPAYEVRVADMRAAPQWMREGCEMRSGDLRDPLEARQAMEGCELAVLMAAVDADTAAERPHALLDGDGALDRALVAAAIANGTRRLLYVSCAEVYERAELFPTPEEHAEECPLPRSEQALAKLYGEALCRAAQREHGLEAVICRVAALYGSLAPALSQAPQTPLDELIERALAGERPLRLPWAAEQTLTPTHVDDVAEGLLTALGAASASGETFNLAAGQELGAQQLARLAWAAGGGAEAELELEYAPARGALPGRSAPSPERARRLLGWEARRQAEEGIAAAAARRRESGPPGRVGGAL